ncbi:Arylsulfatase [Posidoniimonas polymericola]|uniref:Arylsulfatase n=2 Tax=Posidoniimonas polymericola TaxID=2528002 RepID=A0A5C5YR77_9BACT|nr:Arylsulfatase [Posidoniimonas polymericola]
MIAAALLATSLGNQAAAQATRPNILVIMADDLGRTDIGPYGSEMNTPALDSMAAAGVRFQNFYVTPRCSNTRAQLLTGQQSHAVGLPNLAGDGTRLPKNNVFIPEVLQDSGYRTYMSGKWHLGNTTNFGSLPDGHDRDPRVRGFDHYYGFTENHSQDNFQGNYRLLSDEVPERSYTTTSGNGQPGTFYQTDAIGDYALDFLEHNRQKNAEGDNQPFFEYVAFGAPHFPLQARDEWVDPLVSRYEQGWDALRESRLQGLKDEGLIDPNIELTPRGDVAQTGHGEALHQIRAWDSLDSTRQADLTRRMAIYAAMVERVDYNVGRILDDLEANGELDNTIVMFLSDNGADAEWHEFGFNAGEVPRTGADLDSMGTTTNAVDEKIFYGSGWANAGQSPYRNYKHYTHEGGILSPAIVQWNNGLDPSLVGQVGTQVGDVRDLMPTLLAVAGAQYPSEWTDLSGQTYGTQPIFGESLAEYLATGVETGDRELGWQHEGNRAFRLGDWKLVSSNFGSTQPGGAGVDEWELYDLSTDPTESVDLADNAAYADQFSLMLAGYERWAYQNKVSSALPWSAADFNKDGVLDAADLAAFKTGWLHREALGSNSTFALGDVDLDGDTDIDDFVLVYQAFGQLGQAQAVESFANSLSIPEPGAASVAAMLLARLGFHRRQRPSTDSKK